MNGVLIVLAVTWLTFRASAGKPSDHGGCEYFSGPGTDYRDRNISVLQLPDASHCCTACAEHNAALPANAPESEKCLIAVYHPQGPDLYTCMLKASANHPFRGREVIAYRPVPPPPPFRFSNVHSSQMVLQSAPAQANVWGFSDTADSVSVTLKTPGDAEKQIDAKIETIDENEFIWKATLPATEASFKAYTITALRADGKKVVLEEALFGDVWICSGQSNMA